MVGPKVLDWLLEEDQPSIRYRTLTELLGRPETDREVRAARRLIPMVGWAKGILDARDPGGWWVAPERLYVPKYRSTNWQLIVLADLGLTREHPAVRASAEMWMDRFAKPDGGFGLDSGNRSHLCLVGNTARSLIKFGYAEHPKVRSAMEWLVRSSSKLGGWSCWGTGRNLDSWEGLSAFAVYPRRLWTQEMSDVVERGARFFLERELHRQGDRYPPWFRFHYPVHYYYDLLVGAELLTSLGYGGDPRMKFALGVIRKKRRRDGRWNLDAVHPDVEGPVAEWFKKHPRQRPIPLGFETPGRPSKEITLRALRVLKHAGVSGAS